MKTQHDLIVANWAGKENVDAPYRPGDNLRVDAAVRLLAGGGRFLDLGCGAGTLGQAVAGRYGEVHGLDLSEVAVAAAARRGIRARTWDLERTPYPFDDASFDAVAMLSVIQYVLEPAPVLREVARIVRPDGQVLIGFPNMRAVWRILRLALSGRFPRVSRDPGYDGGTIRYFCRRDIFGLLEEARLSPERVVGVFARPRMLERLGLRWPAGRRLWSEWLCAELLVVGRGHAAS